MMSGWRKSRIKSFKYAFAGLRILLREPNFLLQCVIAVIVFLMAVVFQVSRAEWLILSLAVALVLFAEAVNTAVEDICDAITMELDPRIKRIKDVSAAAVLITAIASILVGLIIFYPHILDMIKGLRS